MPTVAADPPDRAFARILDAVCTSVALRQQELRQIFPGGRLLEVRADGPAGKPYRTRHRVLTPEGGEWVISRLMPGGVLRRIGLEWHAPVAESAEAAVKARPEVAVNAGGDCRTTEARRLIYGADGTPDEEWNEWYTEHDEGTEWRLPLQLAHS